MMRRVRDAKFYFSCKFRAEHIGKYRYKSVHGLVAGDMLRCSSEQRISLQENRTDEVSPAHPKKIKNIIVADTESQPPPKACC